MNKFAHLWPNSLSRKEPQEDLGYTPRIGLREMVAHVMIAHEERLARSRVAFRLADQDGDGLLGKGDLIDLLNELLHVPERIDDAMKTTLVEELVTRAFEDIGCVDDAKVSYPVFHNWTRRNTLCSLIQNFSEEKQLLT